jgi:hypothetical protein
MNALLWKKRAKPRPSARLFIEGLETRMAPSLALVVFGTDGQTHSTSGTEESLGSFEVRTLQSYSITLLRTVIDQVERKDSLNWTWLELFPSERSSHVSFRVAS